MPHFTPETTSACNLTICSFLLYLAALVGIFCFFSFFCLIVLANILIAIIIESYESSKKRSRALFGKARFEYAAHLVARTELLSPEEFTHAHYERNNVVGHVWKILSLVSNIFSALAIVTVGE